MLALLRKLHQWQLGIVLKEVEWRFPIPRGYRAFDLALQTSVDKLSKRDYLLRKKFGRRPFGYWNNSIVFIKLLCPIVSVNTLIGMLFGWARASQFKGVIEYDTGDPCLVGVYRLSGIPRWMILFMIYFPFFVIPYAIIDSPFYLAQHFADGGIRAVIKEAIVIALVCIFIWVFWGFGFLLARFHLSSTVRERDEIYNILLNASR